MVRARAINIGFSLVSLAALASFAWPLLIPATASTDSGYVAVIALFALSFAAVWLFDRSILAVNYLALLGSLAALGAATRIATSGVGGFELIFLVVILGGAALGPSFGFQLGALTVVLSSLFFGGLGPWTPFQLFAVGWVGLFAGLVGRLQISQSRKVIALAIYAVIASYLFGLVMNLWFWPFSVGLESSISYSPEAGLGQNLANFLLYTLTTSTLSWDSVRAIVLAIGILTLGKPALNVLARTKL